MSVSRCIYIVMSLVLSPGIATLMLMLPASSLAASFENIIYLDSDGINCLSYASTRSNTTSYGVYYPKNVRSLDEFLYINPPEHSYDTGSDNSYNILKFKQGSYAILEKCTLGTKDDMLTIDDDGLYTYTNWNKQLKPVNKHVGLWNDPDNFSHLAVAYRVPKLFKIVDYRANVNGLWKLSGNTLSFFANNVNDVIYTIRYKPVAQELLADLKNQFKDNSDVKLGIKKGNLNFQINEKILFASGSAELNKQGIRLIRKIAVSLKSNDAYIKVDGHTDDVSITGALAEKFPGNWELSAARSIAVVRALIANGIDPVRVQATAYSQYRPIASNKSDSGRAQNRRIEITVEQ